jgi:hypothetical protein
MLNRDAAATARKALENAVQEYETLLPKATGLATDLYGLRRDTSQNLVKAVEQYVNSLANTPKEYSQTFAAYEVEQRMFNGVVEEVSDRLHDISVKGGAGTAAGVTVGAATAIMGPTAALAVATTFGTASTGTAIASLSGAAATNAALAWLGGGALAAGGGGMTAGSALLALAGPIGWSLAAATALGGASYVAYSNSQAAKEADEKRVPVEASNRSLKVVILSVTGLIERTKAHADGMRLILENLQASGVSNYVDMNSSQKLHLAALINHVESLGKLLNIKANEEAAK